MSPSTPTVPPVDTSSSTSQTTEELGDTVTAPTIYPAETSNPASQTSIKSEKVSLSIPEQNALHRALLNSTKVVEPISTSDSLYVDPVVDLPINVRPMSGWSTGAIDAAKINELVGHYRYLKGKNAAGTLTRDELSDFTAIAEVLQKHGLSMYL